eukprot:XP_001710172.1 Hypothetical protein GL50803_28190 [Giardia lamblia ATCC 50803]
MGPDVLKPIVPSLSCIDVVAFGAAAVCECCKSDLRNSDLVIEH